MKKTVLFFLLLAISIQSNFAQNLDNLITDFLQKDNANYSLVDREMIQGSIAAQKASSPEGQSVSNIPPFMDKLEAIEILDLSSCDRGVKEEFNSLFDTIVDGNGYRTLISENEDDDKVRILAKGDENIITQILIIGIDTKENEIAIVKMSGTLNQTDVDEIIKQEQEK